MKKKKRVFLDLLDKYKEKLIQAPCPYFGECGGCLLQSLPYEEQLNLKTDYLNDLLQNTCHIEKVHPSNPFAYRNRMDFVTAFGKKGLRQRGSFKRISDIQHCLIMQDSSNKAFAAARELTATIPDHDYLKHEGYLRYIIIRQGKYSNEVMCNFVTATDDPLIESVAEAISPLVTSCSQLVNDGLADLSFGRVARNFKGGTITENFGDIKYKIAPNSFFQSNSEVAIEMYSRIANEINGERVLDLYSGVGSITLFASQKAESILGVEIVEEAVLTANENKELNSIKNASFKCCDAGEFMRDNQYKYPTLILDPPRAGLHPKVIKDIITMAPSKIVYMSCGPESFKTDMEGLGEYYRLTNIEAFDMFPQTHHVELLSTLERK